MVAKETASPPTSMLLNERVPSKGLMIVDITDQLIGLFVFNDVEKLHGLLFKFNVFCDLLNKFFSEQTF